MEILAPGSIHVINTLMNEPLYINRLKLEV